MIVVSNIRNYRLKVVFLLHFLLISLVGLGRLQLTSFILYNILFILSMVWAIDTGSEKPVQLALAVNLLSIPLDIILLVINNLSSNRGIVTLIFGVVLVFCRPLTSYWLGKDLCERLGISGGPLTNISALFSTPGRQNGQSNGPPPQVTQRI